MSEQITILCGLVADNDKPIKGSVREFCEVCAAEVWMSPSSRDLRDGGAQIMCIPCGVGVMQTEAEVRIELPSETQLAELRKHWGES